MVIEIDHIERKFGCCKILWKIENFCLATCKENWKIYSPEFSVRAPHLTTWKIILKPNASKKMRGDCFISAYLKRLKHDPGPDIVQINWKISLLSRQMSEYIFTDSLGFFEKNFSCREDLQSMKDVLDGFQPFEADIIYLQCLLIVSFNGIPRVKFRCGENIDTSNQLSKNLSVFYSSREVCDKVLKRHEEGVSSLSEDLAILYASRQAHDVVLKIKDKDILAHKAILYARNSTLATIFDKNPRIKLIDLFPSKLYDQCKSNKTSSCFVNSDAVERIVAYLYSGNFETVFRTPSVSIYECALVLNITEVIDYYNPDELFLQSTVDSEEFVFFWIIKNFESINQDYILSPALNQGIIETTWRLRLLPRGGENYDEYISIFAEFVDGLKPQDVCLEFAIMDINGEFAGYKRMQKRVKIGGILGFYDFVKRDAIENSSFLENGVLRVIFKLRQSSGIQTSSCECSSISCVTTSFTDDNAFTLLSKNMMYLLEVGKYSDAVIHCGKETFNFHKCILATRTTDAFFKFLNENITGKNEFFISDVKPEIFRIFLSYMYSGIMTENNEDIVKDIYSLAKKFEMIDLLIKCEKIFSAMKEKSESNHNIYACTKD